MRHRQTKKANSQMDSTQLEEDRIGRTIDYAEHYNQYIPYPGDMPKQVHAAHILVKTEDQAKELLMKINSGVNFADLAKKHSDCPSGKQGGDLGWFGKGQMVQEFEKAAFEGEKGKVVGPVRTRFGYHLIRILDQR